MLLLRYARCGIALTEQAHQQVFGGACAVSRRRIALESVAPFGCPCRQADAGQAGPAPGGVERGSADSSILLQV